MVAHLFSVMKLEMCPMETGDPATSCSVGRTDGSRTIKIADGGLGATARARRHLG